LRVLRLGLATLGGFLACGLPLWWIPYREVSLPGNPSPLGWFLLGTAAGAFAALLLRGIRLPWFAVAFGFVLALLVRVAVETNRDPTSHNLWPFEVAIVGAFGLASGLAGVLLTRLVQRGTQSR
jgi:hypothetical protein